MSVTVSNQWLAAGLWSYGHGVWQQRRKARQRNIAAASAAWRNKQRQRGGDISVMYHSSGWYGEITRRHSSVAALRGGGMAWHQHGSSMALAYSQQTIIWQRQRKRSNGISGCRKIAAAKAISNRRHIIMKRQRQRHGINGGISGIERQPYRHKHGDAIMAAK